jgi:hypothetical protein
MDNLSPAGGQCEVETEAATFHCLRCDKPAPNWVRLPTVRTVRTVLHHIIARRFSPQVSAGSWFVPVFPVKGCQGYEAVAAFDWHPLNLHNASNPSAVPELDRRRIPSAATHHSDKIGP